MAAPATSMTAQPPDLPRQQINTDGGVGFLGGVHSHHYGDYQAGAASQASRQATSQGVVLGKPISGQDPAALGVHASITVHDETTLVPYLARDHDERLRETLQQASTSDRASFVLLVGTSCAGKTRTLYEAATAVLPDWHLIAPNSDSKLAQVLMHGIPARTVVWLDELQDRLPVTPSGITAAKAIAELLDTEVGPILVAGTLWPTNHATMRARPDPTAAAAGAGAIPDLLTRATVVRVPDTFTDTDLQGQSAVDDPRIRQAIDTATHTERTGPGRMITQVLAGGTQLIHRLNPPDGTFAADEYSPAAKALLHAAGDLRRVGMPNPLPRWALDGAAPGYLTPPDHRPVDQWVPSALEEVIDAARHDDPLTGVRDHDHHQHGVPALTPHWAIGPTGEPLEAFDLHDYLHQDHLARHRQTATQPSLWAALTSHVHPRHLALALAEAAQDRGLLTAAIALTRSAFDPRARSDPAARPGFPRYVPGTHVATEEDVAAERCLVRLLSLRGEPDDLSELENLSEVSRYAAEAVARKTKPAPLHDDESRLARRRERIDFLMPLVSLAVREKLTDLVRSSTPTAVAAVRLAARDTVGEVVVAELLLLIGIQEGLADLRRLADNGNGLAHMLLLDYLTERRDIEGLRHLATTEGELGLFAQRKVAEVLCERGSEADLVELRGMVHGAVGSHALLALYRARSAIRHVSELDPAALPVFSPSRN